MAKKIFFKISVKSTKNKTLKLQFPCKKKYFLKIRTQREHLKGKWELEKRQKKLII